MVNLDSLAALDLVLWLGTTERAAALAHSNQSTVSRRSRTVLQTFQLRLARSRDGWMPRGNSSLLALERRVHQRARFLGKQPLRLQVPCWSHPRALRHLPEGWCANPQQSGWVCENPVGLLRDRVIDACLITPTQLPWPTEDLLLLDLYRRPIELTVFDGGLSDAHQPSDLPARTAGPLHLRLLPFLPRSCRDRSREWFDALHGSAQAEGPSAGGVCRSISGHDPVSVAFLTPEMREAQERPWIVDAGLEPYPYVERLAVLVENAGQPAIQRLQEHLLEQFAPLAA